MRPFGCFKPSIIEELRPVAPLDSWEKEKSSRPGPTRLALQAASLDVLRFFPERFWASSPDAFRWPAIKGRYLLRTAAVSQPLPGSPARLQAALGLGGRCCQPSSELARGASSGLTSQSQHGFFDRAFRDQA